MTTTKTDPLEYLEAKLGITRNFNSRMRRADILLSRCDPANIEDDIANALDRLYQEAYREEVHD